MLKKMVEKKLNHSYEKHTEKCQCVLANKLPCFIHDLKGIVDVFVPFEYSSLKLKPLL